MSYKIEFDERGAWTIEGFGFDIGGYDESELIELRDAIDTALAVRRRENGSNA